MTQKEGAIFSLASQSVSEVYDAHPNGIGEKPAGSVPAQKRIEVNGLKNHGDFLRAIRTGGPIRDFINKSHDEGLKTGFTWAANEVTVFIADHQRTIKAVGVGLGITAAVATGVGGAIYLARRSPQKKQK